MTSLRRRIVAAATSAALVGALSVAIVPSAQAAPAVGDFTTPKIAGLASTIALPSSGARTVKFTVSFTGTEADATSFEPATLADTNGDGALVLYAVGSVGDTTWVAAKKVKTVDKTSISAPRVTAAPDYVKTGKSSGFKLSVGVGTTPGVYDVRVPITQFYWGLTDQYATPTLKWATQRVTITASGTVTKKYTGFKSNRWKRGQTAKVTLQAPEYKSGSTVSLYFRAPGAKKYKLVVKGKLKATKGYAKVVLKTKKIYAGGYAYLKVGKNAYAAGYQFKGSKIKSS